MAEHKISYKTFDNGDIGISYTPEMVNPFWAYIITPLALLIGGCILSLTGKFQSYWLLIFMIIPVVLVFYAYRKTNIDRVNRMIEKNAILQRITNSEVEERCKSLYGGDVKCLNRVYMIRRASCPGNFERLLAVYLSTGNTVVFKVVQRTNEKGMWSLTLRGKPEETNDKIIVSKVIPFEKWFSLLFDSDHSPMAGLLMFLLIWVLLVCLFGYPMIYHRKAFIICCTSYIFFVLVMFFLMRFVKVPEVLQKIVFYPGNLAHASIVLSGPIVILAIALLVPLLLGLLCASFLYGLTFAVTYGGIGWNPNYAIFLFMSSTSIIMVYANDTIHGIYERMGIFYASQSKSLESPVLALVEYVLQKGNVNSLIYTAYLLLFIWSTVTYYINHETTSANIFDTGVDVAIMKAFLVHLAFTNVVLRKREMKLSAKGLWASIRKMLNV